MHISKLTTILFVESIEPCLASWQALGYVESMRVPERASDGPAQFVILKGKQGELMLQTRASLAEDMPVVHERKPAFALYADVPSLDEAKRALSGASYLIPRRKTFYGAEEAWLTLSDGVIIGLSQHTS